MRSTVRRTLLPMSLVVIATAALCDRSQTGRSDGIPLSANSFLPVDYELTSELYRKWLVAQENLDRDVGRTDPVLTSSRISVIQPTPERIDAVVSRLERSDRTRRAIESAGLSVRDYVLTTVAMYQALQPPGRITVAQLRPGNVEIVSRNRAEIVRIRNASQFQIAADDRDTDEDDDTDFDEDDDDFDDDTDG